MVYKKERERFLKVFEDRSEYIPSSGDIQKFKEGKVSPDSRTRMKHIKDSFEAGFLDKVIFNLKHGKITIPIGELEQEYIDNITVMVESVTSEVGRALVGLMVMQLSIKAISSKQNIRLHKLDCTKEVLTEIRFLG